VPSKCHSKPQGRQQVKRALLDAATELFAAHGPNGVAVRDIARRAGVNYGLVHRHFGSKEALHRAVLDRLVTRVDEQVADLEAQDLGALMRGTRKHTDITSHYFRILARAMLDGDAPEQLLQTRFPVAERMVCAATEAGIEKPREHVARQLAAGLGWMMFEPYLRAATGLNR